MHSKGTSISDISTLMDDTEEVVKNHYLGIDRDEYFWSRMDAIKH